MVEALKVRGRGRSLAVGAVVGFGMVEVLRVRCRRCRLRRGSRIHRSLALPRCRARGCVVVRLGRAVGRVARRHLAEIVEVGNPVSDRHC